MSLNGVIIVTAILRYFIEFISFVANYATVVEDKPILSAIKCRSENLLFGNIWFITIFLETTEKKSLHKGTAHSTAKMRFVQRCAAISAISELLYHVQYRCIVSQTQRTDWSIEVWFCYYLLCCQKYCVKYFSRNWLLVYFLMKCI